MKNYFLSYDKMDINMLTPRQVEEEKIEHWSDEIEQLLAEWAEVGLCYSWLHSYSERKYKHKYHNMSIPIIVLSTLTGTANFAMDSFVPTEKKQIASAVVGGINIFAGILGTLMSFLKYAEIYESHRIACVSWSKFARNIQIELALKDSKRKNCRDFLKVSRAEYDRLLEQSPNVDRDIIHIFNQKFEAKYPKVRKPIICNGLKEVIIYNSDEEKEKEKEVKFIKPLKKVVSFEGSLDEMLEKDPVLKKQLQEDALSK